MRDVRAQAGVALAVATGVAMQIALGEVAQWTRGPEAAAEVWLLHLGAWGLGLVVRGRRSPVVAAAAGVLAGWAALVGAGMLGRGAVAHAAMIGGIVASGAAFGAAVGAALEACADAQRAVAADLVGVGLGAAVAVAARWAPVPVPAAVVLLIALGAISRGREHAAATRRRTVDRVWRWAAIAIAAAAMVGVPLDGAARLRRGTTPLARGLDAAGAGGWRGRWVDAGVRVDAVQRGAVVELFVEGGTQATTPGPRPPLVRGIAEALGPRTAVIVGAGGLGDVDELLAAGVADVVAVEQSAAVFAAARALSPGAAALARDRRVHLVIADGRRFAAASDARFELVLLPLTFSAEGARPSALWPTTLFTVEGVRALARLAGDAGVVCVVFTDDWLRDRLLATIGRIEGAAPPRVPLAARLWLGRDDAGGAYRLATCWSPVAAIAPRAAPSYPVLFTPAGLPPAMVDRIAGRGAAAPVVDARPYFFDGGGRGVPAPLRAPLAIAGVALAIGVALHGRARRRRLVAAWWTGAGFAAVQLASLGVVRAAGVPLAIALAMIALVYAVAGTAALARRGRAWVRCVAAAIAGAAAAAAYGAALPTWLVEAPRAATVPVAAAIALAVAGAAAAAFAALVRAASEAATVGAASAAAATATSAAGAAVARGVLAASALGTLAAAGPVVAIELWFGPTGTFVAVAVAYLAAALAARR